MNFVIEEEAIQQLPVNIDPDIMSGTPVFTGTRVPIDALTNNLADGVSLDEFLENFPTVSRDQAVAILEFSRDIIARIVQHLQRATDTGRTLRSQRLPRSRDPLGRARRLMAENEMRHRK
jgi:uncharacterized protein (DUF433 family)